jgi:CBS domain-containing protein
MTVRDIMSESVFTCGPETTLRTVARLMRDTHCGMVPVADSRGSLKGIITDRDICLVSAGRARNAGDIAVHEAMTRNVATVMITDTIPMALAVMRTARVWRLPVVDAFGRLQGILSLEDVVATGLESRGISPDEISIALRTMRDRHPAAIDAEVA